MTSPFEDEKVLLSGHLTSRLESATKKAVTDETVIPAGEIFEIIINDICVRERLDTDNPIPYMINSHVTIEELSTQEDRLKESVLSLTTENNLTIGDLKKYARIDDCVVGIADQVTSEIKSTSFNDPGFTSQNYLKDLSFEKANLFMKTKIDSDIRVRIAIIDSGYDFGSLDQGLLSPHLEGSDMFEQDDVPQDILGHGTEVANLLFAKQNNSTGIVGLSSDHIELLPIRLFGDSRSRSVSGGLFFRSVKRAVNMGADIINMSFSSILDRSYEPDETPEERRKLDKLLLCSPVMGHAMFKAIERQTFITMSAGHGVLYRKRNGTILKFKTNPDSGLFLRNASGQPIECLLADKDEIHCQPYPIAGPIKSRKDNGPGFFGNNSMPACWSRYLKGAVAVAALDENQQIANFSNAGLDGVEIAAPGKAIETISLNNQRVSRSGTSYAAPLVAGGAGMIIAFFKQKQKETQAAGGNKNEWYYSPWLVEDILLNGSRTIPKTATNQQPYESDDEIMWNGARYTLSQLPGEIKDVRRSKMLHLGDLSDYLRAMETQSFQERRAQDSDNSEEGNGFDPELSTEDGVRLVGIEAYTEKSIFRNLDRVQAQAVAYFSNGTTKVITNEVNWSSSEPTLVPVDSQGIGYPDIAYKGTAKFEAEYKGLRAQTPSVFISDVNIVSGEDSLVPSELRVSFKQKQEKQYADYFLDLQVIATYENGETRDVTRFSSMSVDRNDIYRNGIGKGANRFTRQRNAKPQEKVVMTAFYYGVKAQIEHETMLYIYLGDDDIRHSKDPINRGNAQPQGGTHYDLGTLINTESPDGVRRPFKQSLSSTPLFAAVQPDGSLFQTTIFYYNTYHVLGDLFIEGPPAGEHLANYTVGPFIWTNKPEQTLDFSYRIHLEYNKIKLVDIILEDHPADNNKYSNLTSNHPVIDFPNLFKVPTSTYTTNSSVPLGAGISALTGHGPFRTMGLFSDGSIGHLFNHSMKLTRPEGGNFSRSFIPKTSSDKAISIINFEDQLGLDFMFNIQSSDIEKTYVFKSYGAKRLQMGDITSKRTFTKELFEDGHQMNEHVTVFTDKIVNTKTRDPRCDQLETLNELQADKDGYFMICNIHQLMTMVKRPIMKIRFLDHLNAQDWDMTHEQPYYLSEVDGNFYEIRNLHVIGTEKTIHPLFNVQDRITNLGFRNAYIATASNPLVRGANDTRNVYVDDSIIENDGSASLFGFRGHYNNIFVTNTHIESKRGDAFGVSHKASFKNIFMNTTTIAAGSASALAFSLDSTDLRDCIENHVITNTDCAGINKNILLLGKIRTSGIGSGKYVGGFTAVGGSLFHAKSYLEIEAVGDYVGGVAAIVWERDYGFRNTYFDVEVEGDIRGRDYVGGLFGEITKGAMVKDLTYKGVVRGSEYVGGLVGRVGKGFQSFENIDLLEAQAESTGRHVSDFIGFLDNKFDTQDINNNPISFHTPMVTDNVNYKGSFLGENQKELIEVMQAIIAQQ